MIDDPYKVLGVGKDASMDEVKKAYRKMAKLYHPDMHPNDPNASQKMNEINEAYDMIMNPEKYAQRRAQQEQQRQSRQYYETSENGQSGGYGGYGSYGGFDFNDFFGGYQSAYQVQKPSVRPSDTQAFRQAVASINNDRYAQAMDILNSVTSSERNARWFYLSALANLGAGNRVAAWEYIQKAASLAPNDQEYQNAKRVIGRDAASYENTGRAYNMDARGPLSICAGICVLQLCCRMSMCGC